MEIVNDKVTKRSRDESADANSDTQITAKSNHRSKRRPQVAKRVFSSRTAPSGLVPSSGAFMMTQDREGRYRLYDAITQEVLWVCHSRKEVKLRKYCPTSNKIVGKTRDLKGENVLAEQLVVWHLNTGRLMHLADWSRRGLIWTCVNNAGSRLITKDNKSAMTMWDLDTGSELDKFQLGSFGTPTICCFTTDDSKVIVIVRSPATENTYAVVDVVELKSARTVSKDLELSATARQVVSSFNSQMFAVVTCKEIVVVDLNKENISCRLIAEQEWLCVCFGYDDVCIVALGQHHDGTYIDVYRIADDVAVFRIPWNFKFPYAWAMQCYPSPYIFLATMDADGHTVYVFDYTTGAKLQQSDVYHHRTVHTVRMLVPQPTTILL
jgi:WD40 repeat protein